MIYVIVILIISKDYAAERNWLCGHGLYRLNDLLRQLGRPVP
jgi:hypothetical protein